MMHLLQLDENIFRLINGCRSHWADLLFAFLSSPLSIAMFLVLLLGWMWSIRAAKHWWIVLLIIGACFLFADRLSVMAFKDVFCRLRPCHALENVSMVKLYSGSLIYTHCGGAYGFISSHAANVFALAMALSLYFRKHRSVVIICFIWACLVGYSRVYCGVHYPADVFVGAVVGMLIGWGIYAATCALYTRITHSKL